MLLHKSKTDRSIISLLSLRLFSKCVLFSYQYVFSTEYGEHINGGNIDKEMGELNFRGGMSFLWKKSHPAF